MTTLKVKSVQVLVSIGVIALTLIAMPVSVFAQAGDLSEDGSSLLLDIESPLEKSVALEGSSVATDKHYDAYKREKLPEGGENFNDFVVGPGRFSLEIAPGESKTVLLNISNRLGSKRLFHLVTEDMTSSDSETNAIIQLLGDDVGPYTIKDYISVPYDSFYIESNTRAVIPVTISLPSDAEPGGFYGSILTEVMPEIVSGDDPDVVPATALVSRIGTLFYVTTPGDVQRAGSLVDFTTVPDKKFYLSGPIDMGLVYENTGSVHLTPYGDITITNLIGENVGQIEITPWFIMPNSVRTHEISWNREFLFGRYKVTAEINRGYEDVIDTQVVVFWVFPWKLLTVIFTGVFLFFLLIRFLVRNFEFKKK